jgi:GNAT superfamily N-acetyltransferase
MIHDELDEPGSHWLKAVSEQSGEVAGFAKWQEPKPGRVPEIDLPEWPEGADKALCNETFGDWARKHRELMADRDHWCTVTHFCKHSCPSLTSADLEILATDPAYQGKGAGSLMMRWGLEKADEQKVEAYLEASPDAVPLYHKFGFRGAGRTDTHIDNERVKDTWYRNLFMIRPATSAG